MVNRIIITSIAAACLVSACAHHQVIVPDPNQVGLKEPISSTATAFKGGMKRVVVDCDTDILTEVSVHQNLSQSLISIVTLGTVWPLDFEYQCGKPKIQEPGSLDDEE